MKHNRILAAIVAAVLVLAAVVIGLGGKPVSRDSSLYLTDRAGVVSTQGQRDFVSAQQSVSPRLSVAIVKSTGRMSTADYCETLWNNWHLGTSDLLLLMVTGAEDYYFGYDTSASFASLLDQNFDLLMEQYLEPDFAAGSYEQALFTFSDGLQAVLAGNTAGFTGVSDGYDTYYDGSEFYSVSSTGVSFFSLLVTVIALIVLISIFSACRVGRRRRRPTVFRPGPAVPPPVHRHRPPRPMTPPRPAPPRPSRPSRPMSRPASRPSSGFGGGSRPRSGGGFGGGGRSGGGFGGGGRSGGMGGRGRR